MRDGAPPPTPRGGARDRVAVVGPGRVGQSLAAALSAAGRPVTVLGRTAEPPSFLAALDGVAYRNAASAPPASSGAAAPPPSTVVFCVPDDVLPEAAAARARSEAGPAGEVGPATRESRPAGGEEPRPAPGSGAPVALHTSGVHAADVLSPLRRAGRAVAAWHPLTALAEPRADAFRGITFAVEGDEAAVGRARQLTRALGGRPLGLEADEHPRYHAAAVFASNFLVACLSAAARELAAATGGEGELEDLLPLARAAVDNLEEEGLAAGATGPLTRGDAGTVRRHLEVLEPGTAELYRRLARELLAVVEGRLTPRQADELRRVLDPGGGPAG